MTLEGIIIVPNMRKQKFEIHPAVVRARAVTDGAFVPGSDGIRDDQKYAIIAAARDQLLEAFEIHEESYWIVTWIGDDQKTNFDKFADWESTKQFQEKRVKEGHICWISPELKRWIK